MYNIVGVCKKSDDADNNILFNVLDTSDFSIGALDADTIVNLCIKNNLSIEGVNIDNGVIQRSATIDILELYKEKLSNIDLSEDVMSLLLKLFKLTLAKPTDNALVKYESMLNKVIDIIGSEKDLYMSYAKQALSGV